MGLRIATQAALERATEASPHAKATVRKQTGENGLSAECTAHPMCSGYLANITPSAPDFVAIDTLGQEQGYF
jgi:hypothetical protein